MYYLRFFFGPQIQPQPIVNVDETRCSQAIIKETVKRCEMRASESRVDLQKLAKFAFVIYETESWQSIRDQLLATDSGIKEIDEPRQLAEIIRRLMSNHMTLTDTSKVLDRLRQKREESSKEDLSTIDKTIEITYKKIRRLTEKQYNLSSKIQVNVEQVLKDEKYSSSFKDICSKINKNKDKFFSFERFNVPNLTDQGRYVQVLPHYDAQASLIEHGEGYLIEERTPKIVETTQRMFIRYSQGVNVSKLIPRSKFGEKRTGYYSLPSDKFGTGSMPSDKFGTGSIEKVVKQAIIKANESIVSMVEE